MQLHRIPALHIRTVSSEQSTDADMFYNIHCFCQRATKAPIIPSECASWSGPSLSTNGRRAIFSRCVTVKGNGYVFNRFCVIYYKADNFCDFLLAFLHTNPLPKRGLILKGKNFLPLGENSFLLK